MWLDRLPQEVDENEFDRIVRVVIQQSGGNKGNICSINMVIPSRVDRDICFGGVSGYGRHNRSSCPDGPNRPMFSKTIVAPTTNLAIEETIPESLKSAVSEIQLGGQSNFRVRV